MYNIVQLYQLIILSEHHTCGIEQKNVINFQSYYLNIGKMDYQLHVNHIGANSDYCMTFSIVRELYLHFSEHHTNIFLMKT